MDRTNDHPTPWADRQERERSTPCLWCRRPTYANGGVCDRARCQELEHRDAADTS